MDYRFEPMTEEHRESVLELFNYYAANSFAAFPDAPVPGAFFDRLLEATRGLGAVVIRAEDGDTLGFGLLRPHHFANTLKRTAEIGYFLKAGCTRRGIGQALLDFLIAKAREAGVDNVVASVSSPNEASIAFHLKNGFHQCGRFERVGRKFDQDFDVIWFQRHLDQSSGRG